MRRLDCHDALKQVKRGYDTAHRTVNVLIDIVARQPAYLYDHDLSLNDLRALPQQLHENYFVRLFASFESSLRHYWRSEIKATKPATRQLLTAIAGRRGVPTDTLEIAHEIREFRNFLIHEEHHVSHSFTIDEATKHLNTFLARLPLQW